MEGGGREPDGGGGEEEEGDSHWCMRCRRVVVGLASYVEHRRAGCQVSLLQRLDLQIKLQLH